MFNDTPARKTDGYWVSEKGKRMKWLNKLSDFQFTFPQVTHNTEAYRVYTELASTLNGVDDFTDDLYRSRILQTLTDIKALSITVDD